ncbi:MAG: S8 family serine peptidase [Planctomycetes bacterium]|nr:S8 family serine peptidase [Planctomycetota bacterium]
MNFLRWVTTAVGVMAIATPCHALELAVDAVNADFMWLQGYTGAGVEIGVIDLFFADWTHPALSGNFLGSEKFGKGGSFGGNHATAVAGAALSQDPTRQGVAHGAGWWTGLTTNPAGITKQRTQTIAAETFAGGLDPLGGNLIEVLTLSIGLGGTDTATDQWSLALDHIAATIGTTIVVAAGNEGPTSGVFPGPPGTAYNILSVGATGGTGAVISEDYTQIAPYSSRGPTTDGRSKPDIVAPGSLLELPILGSAWGEGTGTSFAAPLVAGGATLLIDMGMDRGFDFDAKVIKSVLLNSADKLAGWSHTPTAPLDPAFGAGAMNLESAFFQYDAGEQETGTVDPIGWDHGTSQGTMGNTYEIGVNVPGGVDLLATLVWNREVSTDVEDIEDAIYTAAALENLDLFLYDTSDLINPVASSISTVDNVEHLFLSIPTSGQYLLEVRSASGMIADPLAYSLAWNVDVPLVVFAEADFDKDGDVDDVDLGLWEAGYGLTGSAAHIDGDANGDMNVDGADFLTWQRQYTGSLPPLSSSAAVPEPTSLALAAFCVSCVFWGAARRRTEL